MSSNPSGAGAVLTQAEMVEKPAEPRSPGLPLDKPAAEVPKWQPEHISLLAVGILLAIAIVAAAWITANHW